MFDADEVAQLVIEIERLQAALRLGRAFYQAQRYLDQNEPPGVAFAAALSKLGLAP